MIREDDGHGTTIFRETPEEKAERMAARIEQLQRAEEVRKSLIKAPSKRKRAKILRKMSQAVERFEKKG